MTAPTPRCRACRKRHALGSTNRSSFPHADVCRECQRTCRRKKRYPTYQQARDALAEHRANPWDDPTASVYRCEVCDQYHWGHEQGRDGQRRAKRAEKQRRKALIKNVDGGADGRR